MAFKIAAARNANEAQRAGRPRGCQEAQEGPGRSRKAQEVKGESRRAQEGPGGPRRTQEGPGGPRGTVPTDPKPTNRRGVSNTVKTLHQM